MKTKVSIVLLFVLMMVSACGGAGKSEITIENPWVRATAMAADSGMGGMSETPMANEGGANSAAYMVIKNSSGAADKLIKAESDIAMMVGLHISEMKDGMMTMHEVEGIEVPANGQAELKTGSYHIMFMGLNRDLNAGEKVTLTLTFEKAGTIVVEAEVRNP